MGKREFCLPVAPQGRVKNWDVNDMLRDMCQNGMDARDYLGTSFEAKHNGQGLVIETRGATLSQGMLRDGASGDEKATPGMARGRHGDGLVSSIVVALRLGFSVTIRTGENRWEFSVGKHRDWADEVVLVNETNGLEPMNAVRLTVGGLSKGAWNTVQDKVLLGNPRSAIKVGNSMVIKGEKYKGKIYSRGLFVREIANARFGYDLHDLPLDRDRRGDRWDIAWELGLILNAGVHFGAIPAEMLWNMANDGDSFESEVIGEIREDCAIAQSLAAYADERFGTGTGAVVLVDDSSKALELGHYGMLGKVVAPAIAKAVEKARGTFEEIKADCGQTVKVWHSLSDLTEGERSNLRKVQDALRDTVEAMGFDHAGICIVDYHSPAVGGTFHPATRQVCIARNKLNDIGRLFTIAVHEFAHIRGKDGSVEHRDAMDHITGECIAKLL